MGKEKKLERNELHLLYRPQSFDEYIGNDALKQAILSNIDRTRTYLFSGPRGCGKTTLARLIASELNIYNMDIFEIDAADKTGVDDARQIKMESIYLPTKSKQKIYIIDECHRLTGNAWDSLLKTLEEPPLHCVFVLCTTEINKVPATIKSRSKIFEVKPLMRKDSFKLINWVCDNENIKLSEEVINKIVEIGEGIPREIVVSIDTVKELRNEEEMLSVLISPSSNSQVIELCQALLETKKWDKISKIVKGIDEEPERVRYAILKYMSNVLLNKDSPRAADLIQLFSETYIYIGKTGLILSCYLSSKL